MVCQHPARPDISSIGVPTEPHLPSPTSSRTEFVSAHVEGTTMRENPAPQRRYGAGLALAVVAVLLAATGSALAQRAAAASASPDINGPPRTTRHSPRST